MSDLLRSYPWRAASIDDSSDGLTLEGYAAVFDTWSEVDNWEGNFLESISRGAFTKTLKERGDRVPLLYDHGHHPMVGQMPLGRIESLVEDQHGLKVRARLHENWLVEPVRDAIRSGALKEMSFRFQGIAERIERPTKSGELPKITRTEVKLIELGPATIGVYAGTSVNLRAWAAVAPAEFRSSILDLGANSDSITNVSSTPPSAGSSTEDSDGAADREEPTDMVTLRERRLWVARLRGVTGHAEPPGPAERRAG